MKQLLLTYFSLSSHTLFNIGDYIQSIAARQFLDSSKTIHYIDRERLDLYDEELARLIMNGWFMHDALHWPPSSMINPLIVSFHINKSVESLMLNQESIDFYKKFEPVGCRDLHTYNALKSKGVNSYFSGCLTLTLGRTYKNTNSDNVDILIVDPLVGSYVSDKPDIKELIRLILIFVTKIHVVIVLLSKFSKVNSYSSIKDKAKLLLNTLRYYSTFSKCLTDEVMLKAKYLTHMLDANSYPNDDIRFTEASNLLTQYSQAKYVITSRIHCALPCLSMGTPVVYIINQDENDISHCRFGGIKDLFRTIDVNVKSGVVNSNFYGKKLGIDSSFLNDVKHLEYSDKLIKVCSEYMSQP